MFLRNKRQGSANSKTRSEVRGGGIKPYTQKKTGNARRGTIRSPLLPGGGVLFGPKPRDWSISMTKKEKRLATATAIQNSSEIITVVDNFSSLETARTKLLINMLKELEINPEKQKTLLISKVSDRKLLLAGRNIKKLNILNLSSLNIYDVLNADKIVLEKDALASINLLDGKK
jgi:large subunit ribosomal protein L4